MSEDKSPPPIALLCPEEMPGVSSVMRNMEAIKPNYCKFFPLESKHVRDLPQAFHDSPMIILGGWDPDFYKILAKRRNGISVLLCSSLGQMELSRVEMNYLDEIHNLMERGHIDNIIVGSIEVFTAFAPKIDNMLHMPYPVDISEYGKFKFKNKPTNYIGMFMPMHYRKNIYNQIYGLSYANIRLRRQQDNIVNLIELKTNGPLEIQGLNVQKTGWMDRKTYLETVKKVKLGMHVTLTESFGYGALDYLLSGTPVLMSPTVAINLGMTEDIVWDELVVVNSDSVREIGNTVYRVLTMDEEDYKQLSMACWVHSRKTAKNQNVDFAYFIDELVKDHPEISSVKT